MMKYLLFISNMEYFFAQRDGIRTEYHVMRQCHQVLCHLPVLLQLFLSLSMKSVLYMMMVKM
ncbi:hypothetical protein A9196_20185 [Aeromonas dhakensis]|nr:hypothetical protein A9196_20185 [Aeromonas dhakensis]